MSPNDYHLPIRSLIQNSLDAVRISLADRKSVSTESINYVYEAITDPEEYRRAKYLLDDVDLDQVWSRLLKASKGKLEYKNEIISNYDSSTTDQITDSPRIIKDVSVVNHTLIDKVSKDRNLIYKMGPRQFEFLIAELFEKAGYKVTLTPQTRDGGKDLIILENKMIGNFLIYVECKNNARNNHVGVQVVRELYGSVIAGKATAGLIVTSSYFSPAAKEFTDTIKYQMSLMDYKVLNEWIKKLAK